MGIFLFRTQYYISIKICFVSEIELCEALETSKTQAKEITELTLELKNSRKPCGTNQEGLENE